MIKTRILTIIIFIQHSAGSLGQTNQAKKERKDIKIGKKEVKIATVWR
jgi:hypothetical protein